MYISPDNSEDKQALTDGQKADDGGDFENVVVGSVSFRGFGGGASSGKLDCRYGRERGGGWEAVMETGKIGVTGRSGGGGRSGVQAG